MQDEWLDIVDENDVVIGKKLRSEVHKEGLRNYRAVNLFIVNSKGDLWIPRRTAHKQLFPLGLDFSCAGHVQSGDTYEETLRKEVAEELNVDILKAKVRHLGKLTPSDSPCFSETYEMRMNEAPKYNPDDFISAEWVQPEALARRLEAGEYAKDCLIIAIKKFYLPA